MTSRCSASVRIEAGAAARAVFEAISPDSDAGGARVRVGLDGDCVVMDVEASRPQHLRAALNSHLRLAHASIESIAQ